MFTKKIIPFLLVSCLLLSFGCKKEDLDIQTAEELEAYIADEMEDQHIPGLSMLVFKDNAVVYEGVFGQSNIQDNVTLAEDHVFLLASISKTITATALLQLYDQGEFALDDPINNYLPFAVNIPNYQTDITFRMLLTHTSGIADGPALDSQYYYGEDSPVDLADFLENYLVPGGTYYDANENFYDFEPGTQHEYSNEGSALIAVLVEEISGVDFNTYCKQNIFQPLGMTNTFWRLDEISGTIVTPYEYANRDYEAFQHYTFTDYPNGGLRSNAQDMFFFLSTLEQGGTRNNVELLKSSTVDEIFTPQIPSIDAEVGLHMFVMNADNGIWGHDGGENGVATIMGFNPDTKVGVIVLANESEANLDQIMIEGYGIGL